MESVWFQTLVIILSVMLALFLLLAIVVMVRLIQISKQIKRITDYAENTVEKAEEVASFFKKSATPVAIMKLISNISSKVTEASNHINKKRKK